MHYELAYKYSGGGGENKKKERESYVVYNSGGYKGKATVHLPVKYQQSGLIGRLQLHIHTQTRKKKEQHHLYQSKVQMQPVMSYDLKSKCRKVKLKSTSHTYIIKELTSAIDERRFKNLALRRFLNS